MTTWIERKRECQTEADLLRDEATCLLLEAERLQREAEAIGPDRLHKVGTAVSFSAIDGCNYIGTVVGYDIGRTKYKVQVRSVIHWAFVKGPNAAVKAYL